MIIINKQTIKIFYLNNSVHYTLNLISYADYFLIVKNTMENINLNVKNIQNARLERFGNIHLV